MNTAKFLISGIVVVSIVAGFIASQARESSVVYTGFQKDACTIRTPGIIRITPTLVGGTFATISTNGLCSQWYILATTDN